VTAERANRILIVEAQMARQRALIARLQAERIDTTEAKSMLSALRYTLRILRRRRPKLSVVNGEEADA
jgi:hypothetical protein